MKNQKVRFVNSDLALLLIIMIIVRIIGRYLKNGNIEFDGRTDFYDEDGKLMFEAQIAGWRESM